MAPVLVTNPAHDPGHTCLAFSPDGKWAYTGGSDTLVRIWRTDKGADQEPQLSSDAGEGITSLSASKTAWLSASEDSDVRSYQSGDSGMDTMVTSAVGVPVRCVAVDPKGKRVAVTSDELVVKIVDIADNTKVILLNGHTRGVRKATWHPSGSLLTTCGSDGKIIVWDVSDDHPKQEKTLEGIIPAIPDAEAPEFQHDCSALWHPSGTYFFIANRTHEIVTICRPFYDIESAKAYSDPSHPSTGPVTALAVSPNGLYLASASRGEVRIWSTEKRRVLWSQSYGVSSININHLAFSPTQNLLAWTDTDGIFTRWPSVIPLSAPDPVKIPSTPTVAIQSKGHTTPDLFGDDVQSNADVAMEEGGGDDGGLMDDDWIIDDLGGGMRDERVERRGVDAFVKEMVSITKAQPAFQPGSTPMDHKKRYLAFNMIGAIEVTDQDTHQIVNVVFHDQSSRKGYHFTDHLKYDLASMGERGILYSCPPENDHPAQVFYKPYTTWSSSSSQYEWTYSLTKGSKVIGLAAGGGSKTPSSKNGRGSNNDDDDMGHLVIATTENDLTFMSGNKTEKFIQGLDGEFVAMVAGEEWVFFAHRPGATTIDGSQGLLGTIITFDDYCVHQRSPLPIAKGHILKWIGITEEGAPVVYDSAGLLHIMANFRKANRGNWARMLDTNQLDRRLGDALKQESYWPIGVNQETFSCIIVKGTASYPGFPRPFPSDLPMRIPFRGDRGDDPKKPKDTVLEEQIARENIHLNFCRDNLGDKLTTSDISRRELEQDKVLVKLINAACKDDKSARVLEFVNILNHVASFDGAIKIAHFYRLVGLKEKIEAIKDERGRQDRLETARDRRRDLTGELMPIPAPKSNTLHPSASDSNRPRLLEDFRPPPTTYRPGLAPAIPVVETSRFSTANLAARTGSSDTSTPPEKRKSDDELNGGSKRQALEAELIEHTNAKVNPFAKKLVQENIRNPFARKQDANKTIHKSDSFFEKVDAAEMDQSRAPCKEKQKGKEKEQNQPRQIPLSFAGKSVEKVKKKTHSVDSQSTRLSQADTESSTQAFDSMAVDEPLDITIVETQRLDEQHMAPEEIEEMQLESQDVDNKIIEEEWPQTSPKDLAPIEMAA